MKPGRLRNICVGFCEIADGLYTIFTLGGAHRNFTFRFLSWCELRYLKSLRVKK